MTVAFPSILDAEWFGETLAFVERVAKARIMAKSVSFDILGELDFSGLGERLRTNDNKSQLLFSKTYPRDKSPKL